MGRLIRAALVCSVACSGIDGFRIKNRSTRASDEVAERSSASPAYCAVPDWVLNAARYGLVTILQDALSDADPWDYNMKNVSKETDIWVCTFKVVATADVRLTGLRQIQNSDFGCLESVCHEPGGWTGCSKYRHVLSATFDIGSLGFKIKDRSQWECGATVWREMDLSYDAGGFGIAADFVLEQTTFPPSVSVVEVLNVNSTIGTTSNHSCSVQGVDLNWICEPAINMMTDLVDGCLKPTVDRILQDTLNYILLPDDPEDPDNLGSTPVWERVK